MSICSSRQVGGKGDNIFLILFANSKNSVTFVPRNINNNKIEAMELTLTLSRCVEVAKKQTLISSEMKDWKIRNKHNRRMREIARELVKKNGGYVIGTPAEVTETYGVNVGGLEDPRKFVWGIDWNNVWKQLQFAPIYGQKIYE